MTSLQRRAQHLRGLTMLGDSLSTSPLTPGVSVTFTAGRGLGFGRGGFRAF